MLASPSASTPIRSPIICLKIWDANTIGGRYSEADQVRESVVALKNINSHIQLPNLILKHFRDETDDTKKVWYLDISSGKIRQSAALSIVAPLSPKVALFLFSAKSHPEWENGFAVVRLGEIIEEMNIYALKYEYMFNKAFVASNSYQELEQLQKFREDHLAELEMLNADI